MQNKDTEINDIMGQIVQFTIDRDWEQFHNGKDLALALSIMSLNAQFHVIQLHLISLTYRQV